MRLPPVQVLPSSLGDEYCDFRTLDGLVVGTALRASGCGETHYDILDVRKNAGTALQQMVPVPNRPGAFEVRGEVELVFEDGVAVVMALGFSFWVDREESPVALSVGDAVALRVENLELYV